MSAQAADKLTIAAAPAWVKPVSIDAKAPTKAASAPATDAPAADDGRSAIRILLNDKQVKLEPGHIAAYSASVFRIQTPQGLAAGNINFAWQPETDDVIVHKLLIRHGDGSLVDVLAAGQTFTVVRRESNLESAMLDGVLTANIQPEGLQVGDTVEFAMTVVSSDPVLKGHVEFIGGNWNALPIDRAHLNIAWNPAISVRVQPSKAIPAPKIARGNVKWGVLGGFDILLNAIEPVSLPAMAPGRFRIGRAVELTDFASWADLSALLAPLYAKAATLPEKGPLADEAAKIKGSSSDPVIRAQAALRLVEDRVRYVALLMGSGGLTPADAETTWSRRFGDCKAKTALLIALLRDMGIAADPVIVNAFGGDGMDERLPMAGLFNHVIVRAQIAGKTYWLDGTRTGDRRLDQLDIPDFGWGLPLLASGGALVRILPPPLERPTETVSIRIDARGGIKLPAPTVVESVTIGDDAFRGNLGMSNLAPDARDRAMRDYWKKQYDFIDIRKVGFSYDADKRELRFTMEGDARMEWKDGWYNTDGTAVGYRADFRRDPGPDSDAPYIVPYPFYTKSSETILLPDSFRNYVVPPKWQVSQTAGGIEYRRSAGFEGGTFTAVTSQRSMVSEIAAADAPAAQAALRALAGNDINLRQPSNYMPTDKELAASLATKPDSADAYVDRAMELMQRDRYDQAIADLDSAIALDPVNALAFAERAVSHAVTGKLDRAVKDADTALKLNSKSPVAYRARGLVAEQTGKYADAVAAFTASLDIYPGNPFSIGHRGIAYQGLQDYPHALADFDSAINGAPGWTDLYLRKATLLTQSGDRDGAAATARALAAANPDHGFSQVAAARIFARAGKPQEAMAAFDRAIAIQPEAYIYLNRAHVRRRDDIAGRRADIDMALKLDPKSEDMLVAKAQFEQRAGNPALAVTILSGLGGTVSASSYLLAQRGIAYALAGQQAKAGQDFAAARAKAKDGMEINNICFAKAAAGVVLNDALADCDAALAKLPDSSQILDSRGFVLLRLGRYDEAIADYDKALAKRPKLSDSLLGRAIAWARKGDKARSEADLAAARKSNPDIEETFADYGVKL